MGSRRGVGVRFVAAVALLGALVVGDRAVSAAPPDSAADGPNGAPVADLRGESAAAGIELTSSELRAEVEAAEVDAAAADGTNSNGAEMIQVEVHSSLPQTELESIVRSVGGTIDGAVPGRLVLAHVPADQLEALEARADVDFLTPPGRVDIIPDDEGNLDLQVQSIRPELGPRLGEHVQKSGAAAWHSAGITGAGVKIGIIDVFGPTYAQAQTAGEVPAPAGTFCMVNGTACDIFASGATHGVAVSEVVADVAPGATLYLATAISVADLQGAVNYFNSNGVKIITRSLSAMYDGPGDGTGDVDTVVNDAVAKGMTWFNSAGNSAGRTNPAPGEQAHPGGYWRGTWNDPDSDGYLNFAGTDELMEYRCGTFFLGFRWSDWGANRTDYDLHIYYDNGGGPTIHPGGNTVHGLADQQTGARPIERPGPDVQCINGVDYFFAIQLFDAGNGTAGDTFEVMVNSSSLERSNNPFSATQPASDSASPGAISVGAVAGGPETDDPFGTSRAYYSSQGPTNDNRIKPDLSAATCLKSLAQETAMLPCFDGTSAATPAAAGAAALVLQAGLANTPQTLKTYLQTNAVDRGAAGPDNEFGYGEVFLPSPGFTAIAPVRVFDTRPNQSPDAIRSVVKQKLQGNLTLEVKVTDLPGVPASGVGAVSLNVTATNPDGNGFITVYPCGTRDLVSSVNYGAGQTVANAVIAPVSATGTVCFYSLVPADVLADINGWFPSGSNFKPVAPARVFDTRPGESPNALRAVAKTRVGSGYVLEVKVTDLPGGLVPAAGVVAVSLNVAVIGPAGNGFLTVYPCGNRGEVSSVNYGAGQTVANAVIAPVSATGMICFFSQVPTDVLADINGWFAPGGFTAVSPVRVFDTRPGEGANALRIVPKTRIGGAQILEVKMTDLPGGVVPASGVGAVSLNVVATNTGGNGFVTVYPCGVRREVSSVNYLAGQTVANAVIAPVSATGGVCFYSLAAVDIVVDINGWFRATN